MKQYVGFITKDKTCGWIDYNLKQNVSIYKTKSLIEVVEKYDGIEMSLRHRLLFLFPSLD